MPLVRAADARRRERPGASGAGLATPSLGAAELIVCSASFEPGFGGGAGHKHDREEVVVIVAGSGVATLDGEDVPFDAGDTVIVPPGVMHSFAAGDDGFECITCEPAGIRFFDAHDNEMESPWTMH
jgi:quercetin dioxygenase-like cupin family protein